MSGTEGKNSEADRRRRFRKGAMVDALIWLALIGLGAASLMLAYRNLGAFNLVVALAIAALQIALIGAFFMQLRSARALTLLTAGSAFVFVTAMFLLTLNDLFTRV